MNMRSFFILLDRGQIDIFVESHSVYNYEYVCVFVFVIRQMQQKGFGVEAAWMFQRIHLLILDNPSRRRRIKKLNYKRGKYLDMNYLNHQYYNSKMIHGFTLVISDRYLARPPRLRAGPAPKVG